MQSFSTFVLLPFAVISIEIFPLQRDVARYGITLDVATNFAQDLGPKTGLIQRREGAWLVDPKKDHSAQLVGRRLLQLIDCLVSC